MGNLLLVQTCDGEGSVKAENIQEGRKNYD